MRNTNAPTGAPGFDAGYTLIPSTAMIVDKSSTLGQDTNSDGRFGPGDIVQYDIAIADAGALSFTDLNVSDAIPLPAASYVLGSTTYDDGSGIDRPFSDDAPPAATAFPFDEGGAALPTIAPGTTVHIRYRVEIAEPFPAGTSISNIVDVESLQETGGDVDVIDLVAADLSLDKQVTVAPTYLGDNATFRLTLSNAGLDTAEGVVVTDRLPDRIELRLCVAERRLRRVDRRLVGRRHCGEHVGHARHRRHRERSVGRRHRRDHPLAGRRPRLDTRERFDHRGRRCCRHGDRATTWPTSR